MKDVISKFSEDTLLKEMNNKAAGGVPEREATVEVGTFLPPGRGARV